MAWFGLRGEPFSDAGDTRNRACSPNVNRDVDAELAAVHRPDRLNRVRSLLVRVHLKDGPSEQLHHVRVAQLPNRKLSPLDVLLNPVLVALVEEFGTDTRVGHALKDGLLNVQIDDVTLIFAVDEDARGVRVVQHDIISQLNAITGVAQPAQPDDLDLVKRANR